MTAPFVLAVPSKGRLQENAEGFFARAGLKLAHHGVVMENGTVRLTGSGREVLEHPEIGELYLGGAAKRQ